MLIELLNQTLISTQRPRNTAPHHGLLHRCLLLLFDLTIQLKLVLSQLPGWHDTAQNAT